MDSIEILNSVEIGGILTAAFEMSDGNLAVGSKTGVVSILSSNGIIEESFNLEGEIIGLFEIEDKLIVGSSISGICAYSKGIIWKHELESGCDKISLSGSYFLVADSSGNLFKFNSDGQLLWEREFGQITHLCSNKN